MRESARKKERDASAVCTTTMTWSQTLPPTPPIPPPCDPQNKLDWLRAVRTGDPAAIARAQTAILRRRAVPGDECAGGDANDAISLNRFMATHQSEEAAAFHDAVDASDARRWARMAWAWRAPGLPGRVPGQREWRGVGGGGQATRPAPAVLAAEAAASVAAPSAGPGALAVRNPVFFAAAQQPDTGAGASAGPWALAAPLRPGGMRPWATRLASQGGGPTCRGAFGEAGGAGGGLIASGQTTPGIETPGGGSSVAQGSPPPPHLPRLTGGWCGQDRWAPKGANAWSRVETPRVEPGGEDEPGMGLFTWGEVGATPVRLDDPHPPSKWGGGYQPPETPHRDVLGRQLARGTGRGGRGGGGGSGGGSVGVAGGITRPGGRGKRASSPMPLSDAARRLASGLRTPSGARLRSKPRVSGGGARATTALGGGGTVGGATPLLPPRPRPAE